MTSLLDRYVYTALRRVPEGQRADIDRELRASIEDAVEARTDAGQSHDEALESALTELGDPDRLADRYADRKSYLIGPDVYPSWRRVMSLLFTIVLPIVVAVAVAAQLFDDPQIGKVIGEAISSTITVGAHLAFWTTLVFWILERTGAKSELNTPWTLKSLPDYEPGRISRTQLVPNLLWPILLVVALVWQQVSLDTPVLDPAGWSFWWPFLIGVLALEAAYAVWVFRVGAWTRTVAVVNAALQLLSGIPLIWLFATDRFFNPAYDGFSRIDATNGEQWANIGGIIIVVAGILYDIIDVTVRAERARRGLHTRAPGTGNHYTYS